MLNHYRLAPSLSTTPDLENDGAQADFNRMTLNMIYHQIVIMKEMKAGGDRQMGTNRNMRIAFMFRSTETLQPILSSPS